MSHQNLVLYININIYSHIISMFVNNVKVFVDVDLQNLRGLYYMFYNIYIDLCKQKGISPSKAAEEMGFHRSSVTNWKTNGYTPRREILLKVAEYFGVTVDFLLGDENKKSSSEDKEVWELREMLHKRPEMKTLFKLGKKATKEQIEQTIKIIEALNPEAKE